MKLKLFILVLIYISSTKILSANGEHPDFYLSVKQIVNKYGYPFEEHEVTTEDGYILGMFRIPHGKRGSGVNKKPILLIHGMGGVAENFIVNGMNNGSLAYILADNNYDVWIGNCRGTPHGKKHLTLNPKEKKFWDFSFHEMGLYDIPAKIDYMMKVSKKNKIYYIGHSQGGTVYYVMCSLKPEYQKRIVLASLLAPGGFEKHFSNPLVLPLSRSSKEINELTEMFGIYELPPPGMHLNEILLNTCTNKQYKEFCIAMFQLNIGGEPIDRNLFSLALRFIATVSAKQLLHYSQAIESGHLRRFDYGPEENKKIYGAIEPPDYPVEEINVPTAMYYSVADNLAFAKDIEEICDTMKKCVRKYLVPNKRFGHLDFVISKTVAKQVYEPLIKFAQKYES